MFCQNRLMAKLIRGLSHRRGQAVVEMTFAFILFFMMFMAIVEFSHLLYTKVTLQHALRTAGRYMVTGRTEKDANNNNIPRDEMIHNVFCANVIATGLACPSLNTTDFVYQCQNPDLTWSNCATPGGAANETVLVKIHVNKPAMMPFFSRFFPSGGVSLQFSTTWKNEPFATS